MTLNNLFKNIIIILLLSGVCSYAIADEQILNFEDESLPILNYELWKLRDDINKMIGTGSSGRTEDVILSSETIFEESGGIVKQNSTNVNTDYDEDFLFGAATANDAGGGCLYYDDGYGSLRVGFGLNTATGIYSLSVGGLTKSTGNYSQAFGNFTNNSGECSLLGGYNSTFTSDADCSIGIGNAIYSNYPYTVNFGGYGGRNFARNTMVFGNAAQGFLRGGLTIGNTSLYAVTFVTANATTTSTTPTEMTLSGGDDIILPEDNLAYGVTNFQNHGYDTWLFDIDIVARQIAGIGGSGMYNEGSSAGYNVKGVIVRDDLPATAVGDVNTYTATSGDKIKIKLRAYIWDDIDLTGCASIDDVVTVINAANNGSTDFIDKGFAYKNQDGYLCIKCNWYISPSNPLTRSSTVDIYDGTTGNGGECEDLFNGATISVTGTEDDTRLVGTITKTVIAEDCSAWDVDVTADDTDEELVITVTGEADKTIYWTAFLTLTEASDLPGYN